MGGWRGGYMHHYHGGWRGDWVGPVVGAAIVGSAGTVQTASAQDLTGAGATFPYVIYSKWFNDYNKVTQVQVNYQSIGSGGGIKAISDQTADFGATDSPMTDAQLKDAKGGDILHIPMALGAVVATYNIPGLEGTKLKLSGDVLAAIFQRRHQHRHNA